MERVGFLR